MKFGTRDCIADSTVEIDVIVNNSLDRVGHCITGKQLEFAVEKTEAILVID